jgi:hypothetical protein
MMSFIGARKLQVSIHGDGNYVDGGHAEHTDGSASLYLPRVELIGAPDGGTGF